MLTFSDRAANLLREKLMWQNDRENFDENKVSKHRNGDESRKLIEVLRQCNFNKTRAAQMLGISRRTLYNRLKKMGYDNASFDL